MSKPGLLPTDLRSRCGIHLGWGLAPALLGAALVLLHPPELAAQAGATTGVIRGTVLDPAGYPLAGATVSVQHRETDLLTSVETTPSGTFVRTLLPPGTYDLTVTSGIPGFSSERIEGVALRVGEMVDLAVELRVVDHRDHHGGQRSAADAGHRGCHEFAAHARRRRVRAAQQRPEFREHDPAHAGGVSLPRAGRRRAEHQRPARHLQQLHRGRCGLQQPVLRGTARRAAAGVHVQSGRHRGTGSGQSGCDRRVRPLGGRLCQRDHQVGHQRTGRHGPLFRAMGRHRGPVSRGARRRPSRLQPQSDRRDAGRPACAGPGVLLPGLRPAGGGRDQAGDATRLRSGQPAETGGLPAVTVAGLVRRRIRSHQPHRRRTRPAGQAGPEHRRPAPGVGQVQLHLVGAGERHVRRRFLGRIGERDRGGPLARRQRQPSLAAVQRAVQRTPRSGRARRPASPISGTADPRRELAGTAAVRCDRRPALSGYRDGLRGRIPDRACRSSCRSIRRSTRASR